MYEQLGNHQESQHLGLIILSNFPPLADIHEIPVKLSAVGGGIEKEPPKCANEEDGIDVQHATDSTKGLGTQKAGRLERTWTSEELVESELERRTAQQ